MVLDFIPSKSLNVKTPKFMTGLDMFVPRPCHNF